MLQEQLIVLNVFQECMGGRERIQLGTVRLNLAEYAGTVHETRRYLMQDSKINSTVKVAFAMHHVGGDANYTPAPRLRGAQVFSGIAGIIGDQQQQHHQQHQQHSHHPHHQQHQRDPDDSRRKPFSHSLSSPLSPSPSLSPSLSSPPSHSPSLSSSLSPSPSLSFPPSLPPPSLSFSPLPLSPSPLFPLSPP